MVGARVVGPSCLLSRLLTPLLRRRGREDAVRDTPCRSDDLTEAMLSAAVSWFRVGLPGLVISLVVGIVTNQTPAVNWLWLISVVATLCGALHFAGAGITLLPKGSQFAGTVPWAVLDWCLVAVGALLGSLLVVFTL